MARMSASIAMFRSSLFWVLWARGWASSGFQSHSILLRTGAYLALHLGVSQGLRAPGRPPRWLAEKASRFRSSRHSALATKGVLPDMRGHPESPPETESSKLSVGQPAQACLDFYKLAYQASFSKTQPRLSSRAAAHAGAARSNPAVICSPRLASLARSFSTPFAWTEVRSAA
jgi:hypothetical protein